MSLLAPLGLLGLLGIVVLIIIYLIKPNYQQRFISSTFVWKLSLKYKKRRLPISKLRNILLVICQVLLITTCAFIFTHPIADGGSNEDITEKVLVIDASISMMTNIDGTEETRFDRAVAQASELVNNVLNEEGMVSIIVAEQQASYLAQRSGSDMKEDLKEQLKQLKNSNYGKADIEGAMKLAETVLKENPDAEVVLYTDTEYIDKGKVSVVNVAKAEEWNAAILNCKASVVENLYVFDVDVACYNYVDHLVVNCIIDGVNGTNESYTVYKAVNPSEGEKKTVRFDSALYEEEFRGNDAGSWVYSFREVYIYLETTVADSFSYDDEYYIFGGEKERVDVQYYSTLANPFFDSVFGSIGEVMRNRWDIYVDTVKEVAPAFKGFDFYLFEHAMPDTLPSDGVVFLVNPTVAPKNMEVQFGSLMEFGQEVTLTAGVEHPITQYVNPKNISVKQFVPIEWYNENEFTPLMYCEGKPIMLVKDTPQSKVIIFTGNLHYSDLAVRYEFPILMYNIVNYFFPATVEKYAYEVGETVTLNARGEELEVVDPAANRSIYKDLPVDVVLSTTVKGVYSMSQLLITQELTDEYFFVKIPASESNIFSRVDTLSNPYSEEKQEEEDSITDLLIYFLGGLVALMFIEWWLQSRENL